jgi:uncharacterized protein (UPF0261 family)
MTPTGLPTRPDDVADVSLTELAGSYTLNMLAAALGGKRSALAVLVNGTALTRHIAANQWLTALVALAGGATLTDVAEAMGEHPEGVRIGLTMWAVDQHSEEILSLVHAWVATASEPGP